MIIPYNASKEERDRITAEREKKLYQSFENMRKQIDDQIKTMNFSTVSEKVKRQQLEEIRNELQKHLQSHYNALESGLKDDMVDIGQSVLKESESFYAGLQMPIAMSITSFPVEIMNNVVNGSVYHEKWYLSRALWGDYTEKLDQINEVISNGIGLNLPSFEIAKQLEQYVDPSAMTPSKTIVTHCLQDPATGKLYSMDYVKRHPEKDWTGFKEKDSKFRYGKVDYNAQRLARTLINHAYQQNVVHQAQANPFATGVRWDASGGERMCEICEERDGKIFPADDVPLDHPNGMCTFEVVTNLNMMEMSNVLADFVNGEPTEYDDKLYAWYNDRAAKPEQKPVQKEEKKEQRTVDKNDKEFKKYFSKLRTKTGEGGFGHITDIIVSEYGEITTATKLAFYNKYIVGGVPLPARKIRENRIASESRIDKDFKLKMFSKSNKPNAEKFLSKLSEFGGSIYNVVYKRCNSGEYSEKTIRFLEANYDAIKGFKYSDGINLNHSVGSTAWFDPKDSSIYMREKGTKPHVVFHEFGHAVDSKYGKISSSDEFGKKFYSLIEKEVKGRLAVDGTLQFKDCKKMNNLQAGGSSASDTFGAFWSKQDYRDPDYILSTHGKEYWNCQGEEKKWKIVTSETFANMCDAACRGDDQVFKEYLPESYAYFRKELGWDD